MNISEYLKQNIIGQSHVISEVLPYVNLFHAGLSSKNRPVGVLVNELLVPLAEKVLESIAKRQPTIYHLTYENGLVIESKKILKAGI